MRNSSSAAATRPGRSRGLWVSGDFFRVLGITPERGRLITADDDRRGCGAGAAIVSHAFWQTALGGRDDAIGGTLTVLDQPFTIVGVTPARFTGLEVGQSFDVALPVCSAALWGDSLDRRDLWWLTVMGRLKPDWTIARADPTPAGAEPGPSRRHGSVGIWRRPDGPVSRLSIWRHSRRARRQSSARRVWNLALAALRPDGTGAADHLRQPRDADARSCQRPRTRDRRTGGHWRVAIAGSLADADRKPAGGGRRRGAGRAGRAAVGKSADCVPRYVHQSSGAEPHGRLEADLRSSARAPPSRRCSSASSRRSACRSSIRSLRCASRRAA